MLPEYALKQDNLLSDLRLLEDEVKGEIGEVSTFKNFSSIHNGTIRVNDTDLPSVLVKIIPDDQEDLCSKTLQFSWECTAFEDDLLTMQLTFEKPSCVSASTNEGDIIEITFFDQRLFFDWKEREILPELTITKRIGR